MSTRNTSAGCWTNANKTSILTMENTQNLFLELLRSGLWAIAPDPAQFANADWEAIFNLADIQTVVTIVLDGVSLLPKEIHPPFALKMRRIGNMRQVEQTNALHRKTLPTIHEILAKENISAVFMKGQIVATRYPEPLHRQPGDIDFVVFGHDFNRTLQALSSIGKVDFGMVHEHHGMAWINGVTVEPHYKVHNFQRPSTDKTMRAIFSEVFPRHLTSVSIGGCCLPSFPPTFESVFLVSHMVNHVYEEGLGLRQIVDYAMFLNKCGKDISVGQHMRWLRQMRMFRAWRLFTCICEQQLGLQLPDFVKPFSNKEKKMAQRLFDDVMRVGNFGRGEYVFSHTGLADALKNYGWVAGRCLSLYFVCPSEARWWIVSKAYRFFKKRKTIKHQTTIIL